MKLMQERLVWVAILILVAWLAVKGCTDRGKVIHDITYSIIQRDDSLQHYKDAADREHAKRVLTDVDLITAQVVYRTQIDSLKNILDIKDKQLEAFAMIGTSASGAIRPKVDTIYTGGIAGYHFSYHDDWLKLDGIINDRPLINYSMRDSLGFSIYHRRKWFLGRQRSYMDVFSYNPAVRISGLTGVRINAGKPKHFGIGPYVGYGYDGQRWAPSIGISLQYSFIKF